MVGMTCPRTLRVCFVCTGNICRSPMAEVVFHAMVTDAGLESRVDVDSAGTGGWHVGERADLRAVRALAAAGYDGSAHRARQFQRDWFASSDLVIALDRSHERTLRSWAGDAAERDKVVLLRRFDPSASDRGAGLDVPDPYYDGEAEFAAVLGLVEASCRGLLEHVATLVTAPAAGHRP